ncbi:MAG: hypothetical protein CVU27_04630 [Betaproteobacteria bacterium HGW-Betaproteobacteria-20]|jgi:hypothetical protein|nr:MAG: hypothetical protein CVU27_04630 [Betaproteobacteria bacterium HGW-Betaproteobacteria-20]
MTDSKTEYADLLKMLNPKVHHLIDKSIAVEVKKARANTLLSQDRLDLIPKILYALDKKNARSNNWHTEGYLRHIQHLNGFVENDGSGKVGRDEFISTYDGIIESLKENHGFIKRPIVLSRGRLIDGAHRLAAAIAFDLEVPFIEVGDVGAVNLNSEALLYTGIPPDYVNYWISRYIRLRVNTRFAIVWPTAEGHDEKLETIFKNRCSIVTNINQNLTDLGKLNLVRFAYKTESWLGDAKDGYSGAKNKTAWCFGKSGPVRFFLLEGTPDWIELKNEVRTIFNVDKSSIHINDTHEETIALAELIFNKNGFRHLNHQVPQDFNWFTELKEAFEKWAKSAMQDPLDYCLIGSGVLAAYGIREPRDIDFICLDHCIKEGPVKEIDWHPSEDSWGHSSTEIIEDPRLHFILDGLKYMTPELLIKQKMLRNEEKDRADVQALNAALSGSPKPYRRPITLGSIKGVVKFHALRVRYYLRRIASSI